MKEQTKLNKKNIPYISKRSGKPEADLELLRAIQEAKGKEISVQYEVVNEEA